MLKMLSLGSNHNDYDDYDCQHLLQQIETKFVDQNNTVCTYTQNWAHGVMVCTMFNQSW